MPRRKWLAFATVLSAVFLAGGLPLAAQTCDHSSNCGYLACATPAKPAPRSLWGELQPTDVGQLPFNHDSTSYDEFGSSGLPYSALPWFTGIDIENGYGFVSLSHGLQVLDLHGDPANPTVLGKLSYTSGDFPAWVDSAEDKWPLVAVDAPAGVDNIAAVVGHSGIGIAIVDLTDKTRPRVLYQNNAKYGEEVYTATLGGTQYAFMAASGGNPQGGVYMYNMSQARQYTRCLEAFPARGEAQNCPGVFLGLLGNRNPARYVHGVDNFVVVSSGTGRGFDIFDVSNPLSPQLKLSGLGTQSVYGVAMWKAANGRYYLGLRTDDQGQIYDVSCITGACGGLGGPLSSQTMDMGTPAFFVTFSQAGATPFLYFGSDNKCGGGSQREWLFDVSNPAAPHDVSPTGYWGWYYRGGLTGFNNVMPRRGKFNGSYFYRTALSIFDIHQRTGGVLPLADFSWSPNPSYSGAGNPVTFNDLSSGGPTTWSWSFAGTAGPSLSTSTAQNPVVTFSGPGTAIVTLTSHNAAGFSIPVTKTVTIADPAPAIGAVTVSPNPATQCQPVTFTGTGVTGQPTLSNNWAVKSDATQALVASGSGTSLTWTPVGGTSPGSFTGTLTVSNGLGSTSKSVGVTIVSLPALQFVVGSSATPTADPFSAGTVQFHAPASQGATTWTWNFGDGSPLDATQGPNPTHSYQTVGSKSVTVAISNCTNSIPITSQALTINIQQVTPLTAAFVENGLQYCAGSPTKACQVSVGSPVSFTDTSTGATSWNYDWTHAAGAPMSSCNFATGDLGHTQPVITHTYTTPGSYQPCLQVRRGVAEQQSTVLADILQVGAANPPSLGITGPTTGQPGQVLGYSASASNCDANTGIWSWTMIGGTPSSGSGSAITVAYATAGTYAISVTNSNCAGASGGTFSVNVSSGGGGGGGGGGSLAAAFVFSPAAPAVSQAVTFDGTASTGTPSQYSWNFGDGNNGSGATASHTYAAPGTYSATLTITKAGDGTGCFSGICVSELTKSVVVGGGSLAAAFTVTPVSPNAGQAVNFDASSSTGSPTQYSWNFGDGSNSTGKIVLHSFASTGTYPVKLTVSAPGSGSGCSSGTCVSELTQQVTVVAPPLDAAFATSAQCVLQFGINQCNATTGASVTLTANTALATSYAWDFGDGTTGKGQAVNHTWTQPNTYSVRLTVSNAQTNATQTTVFQITGTPPPPPPPPKVAVSPVLLPWVAQSRGVLVQSSDLYIHNPGTSPIDVTLEFRKRGTPDVNPPRATLTIQPGQTQFNADVLGNLFNRADLTGFISLAVSKGTVQPIVTSFNTVTHTDGTKFAQALSGIPMPSAQSLASNAATSPVPQHLIGLSNNGDRMAVFGITNPGASAATYHLSFFNSQGQAIGHPSDLVVSPYGQRQFQPKEIQTTFGIINTTDYRVKVEAADSSQFFPYDSDLRAVSNDPSYFGGAVSGKGSKVYVLGALSIPDATGGVWKTDLVLSNIADQPMSTKLTFTRIGLLSTPEHPVTVTLKAGETQRLANVVATKWGITNAVGVLTVESAGVSGIYPLVQGESYDKTKTSQFGQSMAAFTDDDAAGTGQVQYLVGLRQNASYKSQLWLFNPATEGGAYDLIYRALDGSILGQIKGLVLAPGTTRQVRPIDNPLPAKGVENGFTVQIVVHAGKMLAGAQVINTVTNDPAYVSGKTQ